MNRDRPNPRVVALRPRQKGGGRSGRGGRGGDGGNGNDIRERLVRVEVEIENIKNNMATKADIANLRSELLKWFLVIFLTTFGGFASLVGGIIFFAIRGGFS